MNLCIPNFKKIQLNTFEKIPLPPSQIMIKSVACKHTLCISVFQPDQTPLRDYTLSGFLRLCVRVRDWSNPSPSQKSLRLSRPTENFRLEMVWRAIGVSYLYNFIILLFVMILLD